MRKNSRTKGVSPIVATLLLILVAVAAAVVLYAWVSGLSSSAKSSGAERTGIAFEIEAAELYNTSNKSNAGGNVTIYVRNIGPMPIENGTWSLYVLDPTTSQVIAINTSWSFGKTISPGEIVSTTVIFDKNLTTNQFYVIKVVSPQGVSSSIYVKCKGA